METMKTAWKNKKIKSGKAFEYIFVGCTLFALAMWFLGLFSKGTQSPQFLLFFNCVQDLFADTANVVGYSAGTDVYTNPVNGLGEKAYPPLNYLLMHFMARFVNVEQCYEQQSFLSMLQQPLFLIMFVITLFIVMLMLYEAVRSLKQGSGIRKVLFAVAVIFSAPMLFTLERANTLLLTVFFVILYLFWYDSDNKIKKEVALLSLALAVAFKLSPAVLGIFLLYNKQWKDAAKAVLYGFIVGFLPFLFFDGGFYNFVLMLQNMGAHFLTYSNTEGCTLFATALSFGLPYSEMANMVMKIITYILCLMFIVCAPFMKRRWEKILAVSMVLIILPQHSAYYCILYVIPAMIMFFNEESHEMLELLVLFAFICISVPWRTLATLLLFNYHLAIVVIMVYLIIQCGKAICGIKKKEVTE